MSRTAASYEDYKTRKKRDDEESRLKADVFDGFSDENMNTILKGSMRSST